AKCSLDHKTPLQLLVATILSAQCTDDRVNIVTKDLFKKYKYAADFAKIPQEELEKDIQSTGFYRNKAKSIRGMAAALNAEHGRTICTARKPWCERCPIYTHCPSGETFVRTGKSRGSSAGDGD